MEEQDRLREIDRLIAERVMGWAPVAGQTALAPFAYKRPDGHIVHPYSAPSYSSSVDAAMQVVEKMIARGWSVTITNDHEAGTKQWWAEFFRGDEEFFYADHADRDSLAEAICCAAIGAVATKPATTSA